MKQYKYLGIKIKIMIFALIISVVPLIIVGVLSFISAYKAVENNIDDYAKNITEQIAINIDNYLDKYNQKIKEIGFSSEIQKNYTQLVEVTNTNEGDIISLMNYRFNIEDSFYNTLISNKNIGTICFYPTSNITPFSAGIQLPSDSYKEDIYYKKLIDESDFVHWEKETSLFKKRFGKSFLTLLYLVKNINYYNDMGVIAMTISLDELTEIYDDNIPKQGILYIINEDGSVISSNDSKSINGYLDKELWEKFIRTTDYECKTIKYRLDGKSMQVAARKLKNNNWYVINALPYKTFMEGTIDTIKIIGVSILLCMLGAVFVTIKISRYISMPITEMKLIMEEIGEGNFDVRVENGYKDEFKELANGFNTMIDEINTLRENEKKVYIEIGKAQFLALQAQINPHFIYNTLDTINWMANMIDADNIALTVTSLANILRFCMDKNLNTTSVANEIDNLSNYIKIQQQRYKNKLDIEIKVDSSLENYKIIKFLLQPLIENSIYHGFERINEDCIIKVYGKLEGEYMIFEVIDNGIGIKDEIINNYKSKIRNDDKNGYGLYNIMQRLELFYGDKSQFLVKSHCGKGTHIIITIPSIGLEDLEWKK
ncbi:sensor histidine kinase [Clostridium grantii]|uniref:Sensor histidine kinase YesM n=1 Tax=Clostridium grantii DSM 8605 TaxID=1121316 RepID=A0A1M5VBI7_9CLOT|nr:sensor histidine kinase [Clostridium grantii]SHH72518.1 Sensor histidine kinase YesM [Clostridium grantii DSM 8605]